MAVDRKVTKNYTTTLDDERFSVLWLDVKDEEYLKELVQYVHKFTPLGTEYSIIYNIYDRKNRFDLEWLADNLRENEYINWANETIEDLKPDLDNVHFPPGNHFFTRGIFNINRPSRTSNSKRNDIRQALLFAKDGVFCKRVSDWSNVTAVNANAWIKEGAEVVLIYFDKGYRPTCQCKKNALEKFTRQFSGGGSYLGTYIAKRDVEF